MAQVDEVVVYACSQRGGFVGKKGEYMSIAVAVAVLGGGIEEG